MVSVCSAAKKRKKLVGGGEVRSKPNATCGHAGMKRLKWIFCGARMRVWLIYMSSIVSFRFALCGSSETL